MWLNFQVIFFVRAYAWEPLFRWWKRRCIRIRRLRPVIIRNSISFWNFSNMKNTYYSEFEIFNTTCRKNFR